MPHPPVASRVLITTDYSSAEIHAAAAFDHLRTLPTGALPAYEELWDKVVDEMAMVVHTTFDECEALSTLFDYVDAMTKETVYTLNPHTVIGMVRRSINSFIARTSNADTKRAGIAFIKKTERWVTSFLLLGVEPSDWAMFGE